MTKRKRPNLTRTKKSKKTTATTNNVNSTTITPEPASSGTKTTGISASGSSLDIIRGSRNQGNVRYSTISRNHQCTANAVVALVYSQIVSANLWNSDTIDKILDFGDCLYRKSISSRATVTLSINNMDLLVVEIYTKFIIDGIAISLTLDESISVNGRVGVESEGPFFTLAQGLSHLLASNDLLVFTAGGLSVAVFKFENAFFVFDSHARDASGQRTDIGGVACLLQFNNFNNFRQYLCGFHSCETAFSLFPIIVNFGNIADESYEVLSVFNELPAISEINISIGDISVPAVSDLITAVSISDSIVSAVSEFSVAASESDVNRGIAESQVGNANRDSTSGGHQMKNTLHKGAIGQIVPNVHFLGEMNSRCIFCQALFFSAENKMCCSKGTIQLPVPNTPYPDLLTALLTDTHPKSKRFLKEIRKYNTLLAFGSTQATLRTDLGQGAPVVVISGQIYHRVSNIDTSNAQFGSLYFLDAGEAMQTRATNAISRGCDPDLLAQIDALLRSVNPFARQFCSLGRLVQDEVNAHGPESVPRLGLFFHTIPGTDRKVHAAPSNADEIGAIFRSFDGEVPPPGQVRVYYGQDGFMEIPKLSPIVDPVCYPLLFPHGDLGWSMNLDRSRVVRRKRVSKREFDCYRIMRRAGQFNPILHCGKLSQQYIVDKYVELEGDRLNYNRVNQSRLRADSYVGLQDYVSNLENNETRAGRVVILPSTFTGGPRFMQQNYQDAMAIVCKFGRPSLFITFTCNPQWREIRDNLGSKLLNPQDRPELIARVFEQKRKAFFEDVIKNKIFGTVIAHVYVIEFQKRGLPHMHCLLTLCDEDKLREPEDVDNYICAELPEPGTRLFGIITASLIHGPCGNRGLNSPCMEDGVCSKGYPKPFAEHTNIDGGKRPQYRRRDNGRFGDLTRRNCEVQRVDNRDVVPYNPYLCSKYESHINVEVCSNVIACKYIFKYINKGPDAAVVRVENEIVFDEIKAYLDSRYVSSGEAAWRLLEFPVHGNSHSIFRLPIHLPGERTVYFDEGQEEIALQNNENKLSILEAFFRLNEENSDANQYVYCEIPLHFSFNYSQHCWRKRQRRANVIPRMYTISPKYVEKFHLRILLLHTPGPKSFRDLRTVNGIVYDTFQEAARQRYLVCSDDEWKKTLEHAALVAMPGSMRKLFAYLLCFCEVGNPLSLWDGFKEYMCEDYRRFGLSIRQAELKALLRIDTILRYLGKTARDFNLPVCHLECDEDIPDIDDHPVDDIGDLEMFNPDQLNLDQRRIYYHVMDAVNSPSEQRRLFYLQGSGGTGKTYLYNTIITTLMSQNIPVIAVAFTGIAALLLKNGRTAHSAFRLPLNLEPNSHSSITAQSEEATLLRNVRLIIWDEVTMVSYHALNAVDRLLQDVCANCRPFGGKCILLGGDVKQLLPVATGRVHQIEHFFTNCQSWGHFRVLELTTNMRTGPEEQGFATWLSQLGHGIINETGNGLPENSVLLPAQCVTDNVVNEIYGDLSSVAMENSRALAGRAILCPKNDQCNSLNDRVLSSFPGPVFTILSVDTLVTESEDERANFTEEYLNSITPSGMPLHQLNLKVGVPVILLRNLSLQDGLINGTRLLVLAVSEFLLTAEIVTGRVCGRKVFIPRMDLTSADKNIPFVLKRRQFPVKLCFALTINKAQGQTFDRVGIYLETPVFAHGQLYVAFSRVRDWSAIKVEVKKTKDQGKLIRSNPGIFTKNIVFDNILKLIVRDVPPSLSNRANVFHSS